MDTEIDYSSPVGMVRALIPDTERLEDPRDLRAEPRYLFTDQQIGVYLRLNNGNVKLAAADACDVIGVDTGLQLLVLKTDDKQTDGAKLLSAVVARGKELRRQAALDDERGVVFDLVDPTFEPLDWAVNV